jgi:hypothetical protein
VGVQLALDLRARTWGGRRAGAGRPRGRGPYVPHLTRPALSAHHPVHVTLRVRPDVPSLRERLFRRVRAALAAAAQGPVRRAAVLRPPSARVAHRDPFRLVHFSVQSNHLHLIVEAWDRVALARGIQGLAIRAARAINRVLDRRGRVFADHYHAQPLRSPRQMRQALVYVLFNWVKHMPSTPGLDRCSSAPHFDGWSRRPLRPSSDRPATHPPQTWLARVGWRRWGLLRTDERPGTPPTFWLV